MDKKDNRRNTIETMSTKRYTKFLLINSILLFTLSFIFADKAFLILIEYLRNRVEVVFIEYFHFINFKLKASFTLLIIFIFYSGVILWSKSILEKVSITFKTYFICFPIIGLLIGISAGFLTSYKEILNFLPQSGESIKMFSPTIVSIALKNITIWSSLIIIISFLGYSLLQKYDMKKLLGISSLFLTLIIVVVVIIFIIPFNKKTNAIMINDGQIVIFKLNEEFAAIKPIAQTVKIPVEESFMDYEWFYLKNSDGFFNQLIISKGRDTIFDSKKFHIGNIICVWSPYREHSGFLYPGGISNFKTPIRAIIVDELLLETRSIRDIIAMKN